MNFVIIRNCEAMKKEEDVVCVTKYIKINPNTDPRERKFPPPASNFSQRRTRDTNKSPISWSTFGARGVLGE